MKATGNAYGDAGGIHVFAENGSASLNISGGAAVTATNSNAYGVHLFSHAASPISLSVTGGSLTASGSIGIDYCFGSGSTGSGTPSLTVTGNAVVDAKDGGIENTSSSAFQVGAGSGNSGGIVFDGNAGTVYGNVELPQNLEIKEGETLTIPDGASLTIPDGTTLTNNGAIILENGGMLNTLGKLTGDGLVFYPAGDFLVAGGTSGTDYTYADGVLTVNNGANLTISMAGGATAPTDDRIVVAEDATATVTLNGVNITGVKEEMTGTPAQSPIDLAAGATLTLILSDNSTNTLKGREGSGYGAPGIHVPGDTTLVIQGGGSLSVTGGASNTGQAGAGIGGKVGEMGLGGYGPGEDCGTVVILGGTIQITGGNSSAYPGGVGIGGGNSDTGGDGGTVIILSETATVEGGKGASGDSGADIGGGSGGARQR